MTTDLQINDREVDSQTHLLEVAGQIDLYTAPEFKAWIQRVIERGKRRIVVDLSAVDYMDSTGLGVLVGALKRVRPFDGSITIVSSDENIHKLFELSGLDRSFPLCRRLEDALEALEFARD